MSVLPPWLQVVVAVAAIFGTILAGISLWLRWRDNRPSLKITHWIGWSNEMPPSLQEELGYVGGLDSDNLERPPAIYFRAVNDGKADVSISDFHMELPGGETIRPEARLPQNDRLLRCGTVGVFYYPDFVVMASRLVDDGHTHGEIRLVIQDWRGKRYEERAEISDLKKWAIPR